MFNNLIYLGIGIICTLVVVGIIKFFSWRERNKKILTNAVREYIESVTFLKYQTDLKKGKQEAVITKGLINNFGKGELRGKTDKQIFGKLQRYFRKFR